MLSLKFCSIIYFKNNVEDAIRLAIGKTITSNWWYWTIFENFYDDLKNPIIYFQTNSSSINSDISIIEKSELVDEDLKYKKDIFVSNNINHLNISFKIQNIVNEFLKINCE